MKLGGIFYYSALTLTAFVGSIFFIGPGLVLLLVPTSFTRDLFRALCNKVAAAWLGFAAVLLERNTKVRVFTENGQELKGESALIFSNHRCRIDWMYLWALALRTQQLSFLKIILKDSLKGVPFFGWGMQSFLFVFLSRSKDNDLSYMENLLRYLSEQRDRLALLIFPEGTDLSAGNLSRSHKYSEEKNLQKYNYVLHPKVIGFSHSTNILRPSIDALYDVTMGFHDYVNGERPSEKTLLYGRFPKEVHFLVRRIPIQEVPESVESLKQLCVDSFALKEKELEGFYQAGSFSVTQGENAQFKEMLSPEIDNYVSQVKLLISSFWMASTYLLSVSLILAPILRWVVIWNSAAFTFITKYFGGVEKLELRLHGNQEKIKNKKND